MFVGRWVFWICMYIGMFSVGVHLCASVCIQTICIDWEVYERSRYVWYMCVRVYVRMRGICMFGMLVYIVSQSIGM